MDGLASGKRLADSTEQCEGLRTSRLGPTSTAERERAVAATRNRRAGAAGTGLRGTSSVKGCGCRPRSGVNVLGTDREEADDSSRLRRFSCAVVHRGDERLGLDFRGPVTVENGALSNSGSTNDNHRSRQDQDASSRPFQAPLPLPRERYRRGSGNGACTPSAAGVGPEFRQKSGLLLKI